MIIYIFDISVRKNDAYYTFLVGYDPVTKKHDIITSKTEVYKNIFFKTKDEKPAPNVDITKEVNDIIKNQSFGIFLVMDTTVNVVLPLMMWYNNYRVLSRLDITSSLVINDDYDVEITECYSFEGVDIK